MTEYRGRMGRTFDVATSYAASTLFGGAGIFAKPCARQPAKPIELYEFEACPFCRKVRVALTSLDLDAMIFPCPKNGPRFRRHVIERGGKAQFPFLVDPNGGFDGAPGRASTPSAPSPGREMYESDDIVRYLASEYGGSVPLSLSLGPLSSIVSGFASAPRPGKGGFYRSARAPEQPLELWSFEGSPYCRLVRETLSELEIPYLLHNVGKGSPKRAAFVERSGRMMVPYLVDPNSGRSMFESADIVRYLNETYALG